MVCARTVTTVKCDGSVEYVDTRLIAAVQEAAGARCHEAASLVQAYYFSAEACRRSVAGRRSEAAVIAARLRLMQAKVRLRTFLAERVLGWIGSGAAAGAERGEMAVA